MSAGRGTRSRRALRGCAATISGPLLLVLAEPLAAETIEDAACQFTLDLPEEFTRIPHEPLGPDFIHAYRSGDPEDAEADIVLAIMRLRGVIGREAVRLRFFDWARGRREAKRAAAEGAQQ